MFIDPRHLEQISVIVDSGTLKAAADLLGTSQPALSRMIRTLEARAGVPIFERNRRPLKPTPLGIELAGQGSAIRVARERALELVELADRGGEGILKIGAPPFLCERLVSEAIAGFIADHANLRVDLVPDYVPELHQRLRRNQIDIIIGPARSADSRGDDFSLEPLFSDSNVILARAAHPLVATQVSAADLSAATWVGQSERSILRHEMETALRLIGVRKPRVAFQSESAGAILEMIRTTDFLTLLPRYAVRADGTDGLAILPIDLPGSRQIVALMARAQRDDPHLVAAFREHLRAYVAAHYHS